MKIIAIFSAATALAAQAFATTPPAPPSDPMEGRYGNTQMMTGKDGSVMRARFNRDKTVELTRPDGESMKGEWALEGDQLCIKITMLLISMKRCMPFVPDRKVGDSWTQKNPQGEEVTATIVAGTQ